MSRLATFWDDLPATVWLTLGLTIAASAVLVRARWRPSTDGPRSELLATTQALALLGLALIFAADETSARVVDGFWPLRCRLGVDVHGLHRAVLHEAHKYAVFSLGAALVVAALAARPVSYAARVCRLSKHSQFIVALATLTSCIPPTVAGAWLLALALIELPN